MFDPPRPWSVLVRPTRVFQAKRVIRAVQVFVHVEASSGIVLLIAALFALAWANSPWYESYFDLLHTNLSLDLGFLHLEDDAHHWINDGMMTIFFFIVGLEIKREIEHGELSSVRRALLPAMSALGGMIVPALIFVALNLGGDGAAGWGIPMATDIAFALGVLSLLSRRIPFSVKVFLLALAIADDIGAILVIAVFYTSSINFLALAAAAGTFALMGVMNRSGVRTIYVYVLVGVVLWLLMFESGVHATLAGVAMGLLTPARPFYSPTFFASSAEDIVRRFRDALQGGNADEVQGVLGQMEDLSQGTEAPLARLERQLHPWVSYGIVPLFALANSGVRVSGDLASDALASPISHGVALGLVVGKPLGIFLFTWLAVKLGLGDLPTGATWGHIIGVGLLGGIGFTVSLLITGLAYDNQVYIDEAKLGVLCASAVAGLAGFVFLWLVSRAPRENAGYERLEMAPDQGH